jgi:hypothetical protein
MGWEVIAIDRTITAAELMSIIFDGKVPETAEMVGDTVYWARPIEGGGYEGVVIATQFRDNDILWKEISEAERPSRAWCPPRLLALLTPPDYPKLDPEWSVDYNKNALGWRAECRENAERAAREGIAYEPAEAWEHDPSIPPRPPFVPDPDEPGGIPF